MDDKLRVQDHGEHQVVCFSIGSMNSEGMLSDNPKAGIHRTEVARTIDANGSNPAGYQGGDIVVIMMESYGISRSTLKGGMNAGGMPVEENIQPAMTANGCGAVCYDATSRTGEEMEWKCAGNGQLHQMSMQEVTNTLDCMHDQQILVGSGVEDQERKYVLRRLTPTECARLQGFPDWWTDGAEGSDSAIYKMWGNGIALPCAYDVLRRVAGEMMENKNEGI